VPEAFSAVPTLSRWLSRSRSRPFAADNLEQAALALFGVPCEDDACPVAPFACLGDTGRATSAYCLRADPVHLRADTRGLILFDAATFPFDDDESKALADALTTLLADDGWQLLRGDRRRWYLLGDDPGDLHTTALSGLRGKPVSGRLARGKQAVQWEQRCNELQMLMYSHPVNQRRAERGQPVINGIWIWGGGRLPETMTAAPFTQVFSHKACVRGLALHSGTACEPLPERLDSLLDRIQDGRLLLVLDGLDSAAAYEDLQQWNTVLERYARDWFDPLCAALAGRRLHSLELLPLNGRAYRMQPAQRWQFWKPLRSCRDILT